MSSSTAGTLAPKPAIATGSATMSGRVRNRLSGRWASVIAIVIAVVWTLPTFGLLVSSFRPETAISSGA